MNRLLIWLFSVLYFADILPYIAIAISPESASSENNEIKTQLFKRNRKRPHIIIILADDMGWNDVSFHGSDQIPTPNIDALAYNGVILNSHYVSPLCTPSRSALMTGKYPIHLGMQNVIRGLEPRGLPLSEKLLPQYLKNASYKTHIVGKWHLGFYKHEYTPTYRGYDTHFGFWNGLQDYYNHTFAMKLSEINVTMQGIDMKRNLSTAWDTVGKYSTDLFTEEAVRLINAHDTRDPMFLYLAHLAPHSGNVDKPLQAPIEEIEKFSYITDPGRRSYAAMVSKLDQSVGEVVEALKKRNMLENSIILFMSDNGAPSAGFLSNHGSNFPFRGIKNSTWEGGVRGVAAIWSPLIKKRERISNQLMCMADWLPTLLSAADIKIENITKVDGFNMWPALVSGEINDRHEVLINIDDNNGYEAIRHGNFKYVKSKSQSPYDWIGDSGNLINKQQPKYDPEKILRSKVGIAIAQIAEQVLKQKRSADQANVTVETLRENKLTVQKILYLRRQAQIHCNVTEQEKIPCNLSIAPCLFNIKNDPCEMINIIEQQPAIAINLEDTLTKHRSRMVSSSNFEINLQANPMYWNNTWACWGDSQPVELMLKMSHSNEVDDIIREQNNTYLGIFLPTVVFILSITSGFILFNSYCSGKSLLSNFNTIESGTNNVDNCNNTRRESDSTLEIIYFSDLSSIRAIDDAHRMTF